MVAAGSYSQEELDRMRSHLNVLSRVSDIWIPGDPTLPTGWKIKKYKSKAETNRVHCEYLSPQNQVFRSRKAVVEHMKKVGSYTEEDFRTVEAGNVKIRPGKPEEGWREDESIGAGWQVKEEGGREMFRSPAGGIVWTRAQAAAAAARVASQPSSGNTETRAASSANTGSSSVVWRLCSR